jgi:hypothetical protein
MTAGVDSVEWIAFCVVVEVNATRLSDRLPIQPPPMRRVVCTIQREIQPARRVMIVTRLADLTILRQRGCPHPPRGRHGACRFQHVYIGISKPHAARRVNLPQLACSPAAARAQGEVEHRHEHKVIYQLLRVASVRRL